MTDQRPKGYGAPHGTADSDDRGTEIGGIGDGNDVVPAPNDRLPNLFSYALVHIDPEPDSYGITLEIVPADDRWANYDFENGVWLTDFIEYLCPDLRQRLDNNSRENQQYLVDDKNLGAISDILRTHLNHLRDRWSEIDESQCSNSVDDIALGLLLEKTEPGRGFEIMYLQPQSAEEHPEYEFDRRLEPPPSSNTKYWRRHFGGKWVPFPPALHARIKRFGSLNLGAPRSIDLIASTIDVGGDRFELAVFKSPPRPIPQPATIAPVTSNNRGGRPPKYDWEGFHNEITRIALIEGEFLDRPELHRRMVEWCAKNWPEQPEESEIRKRISRLYRTPGIVT